MREIDDLCSARVLLLIFLSSQPYRIALLRSLELTMSLTLHYMRHAPQNGGIQQRESILSLLHSE